MSEPIYRQIDKGQLQALGDLRRWFENGKTYRITELVRRMDGGANLQAMEDDGRFEEVEDWPSVDVDKLVEAKPSEPEWQPPEFPPLPPPPLKEWAKKQGLWTGRGPVSGAAQAAYAREFGV